jgi:hypothetical protein
VSNHEKDQSARRAGSVPLNAPAIPDQPGPGTHGVHQRDTALARYGTTNATGPSIRPRTGAASAKTRYRLSRAGNRQLNTARFSGARPEATAG